MNAVIQHVEQKQVGVFASLATHYGMEPTAFERTVMATLMPANSQPSREHVAAFLLVAKQYNLNPFTKEVFAFPGKSGGVQAVVSIDGWMKLINSQPEFDGMEFRDTFDNNGGLQAVTCRIFRKDRSHPVEVTEYMAECRRGTDTWKQWPARMLRHKAAIQAARYAFGFAGIVEPDEAERLIEVTQKPEGFKALPTDGAWDGISDTERAQIELAAETIKEYMATDDARGAAEYIARQAYPAEHEIALWTLLDSKTRSAIKKAERESA